MHVLLGVDLRPGERRAAWLLFAGFFLVLTFQYMAKTVRQSTFVDALGATRLPYAYLLVALCSYPLLSLYARVAERVSRRRLLAATNAAIGAGTVLFWWLYGFAWGWVSAAFYVWVAIAFGLTVSQYWSFSHHLFDPRQARRLFGFIGAGALLGGMAGGQVARLASAWVGTRHTLLVAASLLFFATCLVALLPRGRDEPADEGSGRRGEAPRPGSARDSLAPILRSRHLQLLTLMVAISVVVGQIVDLQFNWAVERSTTTLAERTALFGNIFTLIGVGAFVFQILFTSRIHRLLGVSFALRVLPVTVALATILLLAASGLLPGALLAAALALKVGESGVRFSIDQSTRELLFQPIDARDRSRAKAFIDLFVNRGSKGAAALVLLPVAFGLATPVQTGWATLALTLLWLAVSSRISRTYVQSFRTGLKDRTVHAEVPINLADVRTVELLVQSLGSPDFRQVLHSLDILHANDRGHLVPPLLLYHDNPDVRRRTLQILAVEGRRDAAPLIERRLGDENADVRAEAIRVLTELNAANACSLMRPRLGDVDGRIRAAAVTCLMNNGDEDDIRRARFALFDMLSEADPAQRGEAIKAIGAIQGTELDGPLVQALDDPDTRVAREAVLSIRRIVSREGFHAVFLPRLISLLRNRRLKYDAHEAIVSFGSEAVPILAHFMNDRQESIFVRRSLPKVIARIGGARSLANLVDSLPGAEDFFLRTQIVEALATRRQEVLASGLSGSIDEAIRAETRRYLGRLVELCTIGGSDVAHLDGPFVRWDRREMSLLSQMLAERLDEHLRTLFGLLAVLFPPRDIWATYRSLRDGRIDLRARALEYLDNTLTGELRRNVFTVIDDHPVSEKLRLATRSFSVPALGRTDSMRRIVRGGRDGDNDARALAVAGIYTVYTEEMSELYSDVETLARSVSDPLVHETAAWVAARLGGTAPA